MSKKDTHPTWMTLEEVAEYLRLSRSKLYELAQSGMIPYSKVTERWRFFRPEVDEWTLRQRPEASNQSEDQS